MLDCQFIRVTDRYNYGEALGIVIKEINYILYKSIIDMREVLKNDILPNDHVVEPYEIDLNCDNISIYKSWYDFDAREVDEEKIYCASYVDFLKNMFDLPVKRT